MATRTDLGKWMITNGGEYDPDAVYERLTCVLYEGSTYLTLKTVSGVTPTDDRVNYQLMARGFMGEDVDIQGYVYVEDNDEEGGVTGIPELNADKLADQPASYYAPQHEIADAFSEDKTYSVGDYCIHEDRLWKFVEVKEEGEWDENKVVACTVTEEMGSSGVGLSPEMHRMTFRGKNLGSALTDKQKSAIQNGTFDDLFLGDYWEIDSRIWRIVDFDYWLNCGDTAFQSHHLVIMPDACLYTAQMNASNVTTGAYVGSTMYKSNLNQAKTIVTAAFGNAVLTHRELLANTVSSGRPSAGAWYDSNVELPNECMMYGHQHFSPTSDGTNIPYTYTISKTQLALFAVAPKFIKNRENQWLRDVVSAANFASVYAGGHAGYHPASSTLGVRPVFPIG